MVTTRGQMEVQAAAAKKRECPTEAESEYEQALHADKKITSTAGRGRKPKATKKQPSVGEGEKKNGQSNVNDEMPQKDESQKNVENGQSNANDKMPQKDENQKNVENDQSNANDEMPQKGEHQESVQNYDKKISDSNAVTTEDSREKSVMDTPIYEKGLVYFFFRGKVNVEHPESMDEIKRLCMVLRPLPIGTKLVDGKVNDGGKYRLIAIPKKGLPVMGYQRFLTFVEEPSASLEALREKYLEGKTYQTKTVGYDSSTIWRCLSTDRFLER
jgi:hypothetical protein